MEKRAYLGQLLRNLGNTPLYQVWQGEVKSVQGNTCTVHLLNTDLELEDVRLRADEDASTGVLITPAVGSLVLVGMIEDELSSLYVCQVSEVEKLEGKIGDVTFELKDGKASLKQGAIEINLAAGKAEIKSGSVSLKGLFDDLTTLLKSFKVVCGPAGSPSTAVFPDSLTSVTALETKVNQLLK